MGDKCRNVKASVSRCSWRSRESLHPIALADGGLAFIRIAPPSPAGADKAEDVALLQHFANNLAAQLLAAGAVGVEPHAGLAAGLAAGEAPGAGVVAGLLDVGT